MSGLPAGLQWAAAGAVLLAMVALLVALRALQRRAGVPPELTRKLFHLGGGLVGLSVPWLFRDRLPVVVLAGATAGLFVALRTVRRLRRGPGQVLLAVSRPSVGEFCFVGSFLILFGLAREAFLLYSVPLLVLSVADTFAALFGAAYGRHWFTASAKTAEGSAAFFLAAFLCVHVPVLLWGGTGRLESLLVAVAVALVVTMAEAAAWRGLDNLLVPLAAYAILKLLLQQTAPVLALHCGLLVGLSLLVLLWRGHSTLGGEAVFAAIVWGYVVWVVAGWRWMIPPAVLFLAPALLSPSAPLRRLQFVRAPVVLAHIAAGIVWLAAYGVLDLAQFYYPFAAGFAANLALTVVTRMLYVTPAPPLTELVSRSTVKGSLLLIPALAVTDGFTRTALVNLLAGVLAVTGAVVLFLAARPRLARPALAPRRWALQAAVTLVASPLALVPHARALLAVAGELLARGGGGPA